MSSRTTNEEQAQTPAPLSIFPNDKTHFKSDRDFLVRASLIFLGVVILALIAASLNMSSSNLKNWLTLLLLVLAAASCVGAWFSASQGRLSLAAWLLVLTLTGGDTFMFVASSDASFMVSYSFFFVIVLFSMIVLGKRVAYAVALWSNLVTIFIWATNGIAINKSGSLKFYKMGVDDLILLIATQFFIVWLVNYLITRLRRANETTLLQAEQLAGALSDLEGKRDLGEETGQKVLSLSAQLAATANQQAGGSKEQAGALSEVIAYMDELTHTSQLIAGEATWLKDQAQAVSSTTEMARSAALEAKQLGEDSAGAVRRTTEQNQQVNNFYQTLGKILAELSQSQVEMKKVVELISGLGSQTHLLSLNAALEAASAGEYGERFGVVAAEVKALADHSIQASKEVSELLGFLENRIEKAVEVARLGHHQTQAALEVAQESGAIMRQLVTIIERNQFEMEGIEKAAGLMEKRATEISSVTGQQYSASIKGLEKLQVIGGIATQVANTSVQVSSSTGALEELAGQLLLNLR